MPYDAELEVYNKIQLIHVLHKNEVYIERNLLINIMEYDDGLKIKVRDANEYNFNYSTIINSLLFERMKLEQSLEITFREFKPQILDLLRLAELRQMFLRFEVYDIKAKMVFYEKAKLKSLIFLVVDLNATDQNEIIKEMNLNIQHLKEQNSGLMSEMCLIKKHISQKEDEMKTVTAKRFELQNQYVKHLQNIDMIISKNLQQAQSIFEKKLAKLNNDIINLTKDMEIYREREIVRRNSSLTIQDTIQELRMDLKRSHETIVHLEEKNDRINQAKAAVEQQTYELRLQLAKKADEIRGLEEKINGLKKDMQNATVIIAERNKANDEIARDLVQANQMIVNFNNHIDKMANEKENLQQQLKLKDDIINEHKTMINKIREEYEDYKNTVKVDEILSLKEELLKARKDVENTEKQNRELSKLNAVLTRKIAGTNMWSQNR